MLYAPISEDFKCLDYQYYQIGRRIKSTKELYIWTFSFQDIIHTLRFHVSWISANRELTLDDKVLLPKQKYKKQISFSFKFGSEHYSIINLISKYELRINSILFNDLIGKSNDEIRQGHFDRVVIKGEGNLIANTDTCNDKYKKTALNGRADDIKPNQVNKKYSAMIDEEEFLV